MSESEAYSRQIASSLPEVEAVPAAATMVVPEDPLACPKVLLVLKGRPPAVFPASPTEPVVEAGVKPAEAQEDRRRTSQAAAMEA
jgi:hypothetical protein